MAILTVFDILVVAFHQAGGNGMGRMNSVEIV